MQGILMTPDNHKTIRDKLKTQTRRLDHLKEINKEPDRWALTHFMPDYSGFEFAYHFSLTKSLWVKPRYRVGETVYIKEALKADKLRQVQYTDGKHPINPLTHNWYPWQWQKDTLSPMFMPEWAARDFIKITDVRPERLQDITEEDAKAEGSPELFTIDNPQLLYPDVKGYRRGFLFLWNDINKTYPWDLNPWVWRICFNLIEDKR